MPVPYSERDRPAVDRRLRILVGADVPPDPDSGAAGTVLQTNRALRELGHQVDEIWHEDLPHRIRHGNLHYLLELPRGYRDAVRRRCAKKHYDVIQLSQPHAWLAARDHRRSGRPGVFVNRSHGWEARVAADLRRYGLPDAGRNWLKRMASRGLETLLDRHARLCVRYANGLIVGCHLDVDFIVNLLGKPSGCVAAIPHGAPDEFIQRPAKAFTGERHRRLLYIGQHAYVKGPHVLAEVANQLLERWTDARLTWITSKSYHPVVRAMLAPGIQARVDLRDWVRQDQLLDIYDAHGIFLFPSLAEGFGKAPLEALCRGLCVVSSDTGGMRDLITSGCNGLLAPVADIAAWVAGTERLLSSLGYSAAMAATARELGCRYTWQRCAESAVSFYQHLRNGRAGEAFGKGRRS